jgi:two-component system, NtrC family, response regulator AtoC
MLAKAVHYGSVRRSRAFVDVNCAAIPAGLVEGELFGYERGAFTDARTSRPGLLETASGGTLFLDEVGSLPLDIQAKLLVAIEEKRVRRLGGREPRRVDVQVIAATHRDLGVMVRCGEFRADLFHRLNVIAVELPPLRERGEDRLLIAESLVRSMCRDYGMPERALAPDAREAIERYRWPGNIRELRNQIERILLLEDDGVIRGAHFGLVHAATPSQTVLIDDADGELEVTLPEGGCDLELLERAVIRRALSDCKSNVSRAARYLRVTRQTLMYRMRKHGLSVSQGDLEPRVGEDGG